MTCGEAIFSLPIGQLVAAGFKSPYQDVAS